MMKSAQLAPDAILLPTNFDSYRHYSRLLMAAMAAFTDRIEDRGIDENLRRSDGTCQAIAVTLRRASRAL